MLAGGNGKHLEAKEEFAPRLARAEAWARGDRLVDVILARRHRRAEMAVRVGPGGHNVRALDALEDDRLVRKRAPHPGRDVAEDKTPGWPLTTKQQRAEDNDDEDGHGASKERDAESAAVEQSWHRAPS